MKVLISTLALLAFAWPAEAQLSLQISNGRVTLDANNVPARQILSEWARVGGTKIVGGEKIVGGPLTLRLVDMPEKQALEIILRNVAGFMAAPRQAAATPGASTYDRILIMATSSAPAPPPANARGNAPGTSIGSMSGTQRRVPPRPPNVAPSTGDDPPIDDQGNVVDDQADTAASEQPVFSFPPPGSIRPGTNSPVFVPMPGGQVNGQPGAVTAPVITLQPGTNGPTIYNFVPTDGTGATVPQTTPTNGFGVIGSPKPGMIQIAPTPSEAVPSPAPPPVPPTRPPGV
jgi:hypothetical protein